jgi:hypothetical protein
MNALNEAMNASEDMVESALIGMLLLDEGRQVS